MSAAFDRELFVAAAKKLHGDPTEQKPHEWRFHAKGSFSLKINDFTWYDHEIGKGGGYYDLLRAAGIKWDTTYTEPSWITYDYCDEKGALLFQVVRKPNHEFRQRRPSGPGWTWNLHGTRRVLYRLPELINSTDLVFCCEGEKDADSVHKLGLTATCNPGGAGKFKIEYAKFLKGRDCIIVADNDAAGIDHARQVRKYLFGTAKSARILYLPGLGDKEDVSDWIGRGGTREQLLKLCSDLEEVSDDESMRDAWLKLCSTTEAGAPIPNFANAMVGMRNDPKLKDSFVFDDMQSHPMVVRSKPEKVTDDTIGEVHEYLQQTGLTRLSRETVKHAIFQHAGARHINPLLDELNALIWDGIPRIGCWLTNYLGAERNPYHDAIGAMFLRSMVARVFEPGCKSDYMLVLEGEQGILKSMACRVLAGDTYFTDSLPEIGSGKDVYLALRGIWLAEISEMHAMNKADSGHLKAFLSQQVDRYRPPYAAMETEQPRRSVFIGTSNRETYLKDETGGRRFWPVKCGVIKIDELRWDRHQLLAEAISEYRAGVPWWPERSFEAEFIVPEQAKRYDVDVWQDRVDAFVGELYEPTTTILKVAQALSIPIERLGPREQQRIAKCLRDAGWVQKRKENRRWWERRMTA